MARRLLILLLVTLAFLALCETAQAQEKEVEWVRVWPSVADGAKTVRDAGGKQYPSTGPGSNTWFRWGGAGAWKSFNARKGVPVIIKAYGDSGQGACLGHVRFHVYHLSRTKNMNDKFTFMGPDWNGIAPQGEPRRRLVYFVPKSEIFTVEIVQLGFYIEVYEAREKKKPELTDEDRTRVAQLVAKLSCDSWRGREDAQRALWAMGEKTLPLLEKEKDNADIEIRVRVKKIIEALTPATGDVISETAMKREAAALVEELVRYIASNSFGCSSEPARSLAAIGPHAVEPLEKHYDSASEHVRAAVIQALGKLKVENSVETIISALGKDGSEEVRYRAAGALAGFDTDEIRKALKAASENDTSERVRKQALESLQDIENAQVSQSKEKE